VFALALGLVGLGLVGFGVARERVPGLSRIGGPLDGLRRLHLRVDPAWKRATLRAHGQAGLERAVGAYLAQAGYRPVFVGEDPTSNAFSALVEGEGKRLTFPLGLLRSEEVEDIPAQSPIAHVAWLDRGMTVDEVRTVQRMLDEEKNPKHLSGLASTLEEEFPVAASLLRNKARSLEERKPYDYAEAPWEGMSAEGLDLTTVHRPDALAKAFKALVLAPQSRQLPNELFADKLKIDPKTAEAAKKLSFERDGFTWLRPDVLRLVPTLEPPRVSPSALMLAHATLRPRLSGVLFPERVARRVALIHAGVRRGDPRAIEANDALRRAQNRLKRRKWIEWEKAFQRAKMKG